MGFRIQSEDGLVEGGFASRVLAEEALNTMYTEMAEADEAWVEEDENEQSEQRED